MVIRCEGPGLNPPPPKKTLRVSHLALSSSRLLSRVTLAECAGITWLDLDRVEQRYLLAAGADTSVALYDTQVSGAVVWPCTTHRSGGRWCGPVRHTGQWGGGVALYVMEIRGAVVWPCTTWRSGGRWCDLVQHTGQGGGGVALYDKEGRGADPECRCGWWRG